MVNSKVKLFHANCIDAMKSLAENSVDAVVTDSPYGLSFMGKKWDYDVPSIEIWREALRVLKPGGHLLSFFGTRTYHRGVVRIEDAGFEIRDQIMWIYGSGFPKSHNIKEGEFKGWGTALKPANEPIVVARKPLEKGLTVAENVLKYGTGAINIDASRIGTDDKINSVSNQNIRGHMIGSGDSGKERDTIYEQHSQGRWPANILFDEDAAVMLDEQSGTLKSGKLAVDHKIKAHEGFEGKSFKMPDRTRDRDFGGDSGGASRFFYVAKASKSERNAGLEGMPEKLSTKQFNTGMENTGCNADNSIRKNAPIMNQNHHPTVKPIKLMQYLINLVTPPNGIVLDPFMGSGSTGVAAKNLGFDFIGCEMSEEYFEIAKKRIGV